MDSTSESSGDAPEPCPFCGEPPKVISRPSNAEETEFFAAVVCFCGGYSACAHKMAVAPIEEQAKALALAAWNQRKAPRAAGSSEAPRAV